jgi:hypothetical protein
MPLVKGQQRISRFFTKQPVKDGLSTSTADPSSSASMPPPIAGPSSSTSMPPSTSDPFQPPVYMPPTSPLTRSSSIMPESSIMSESGKSRLLLLHIE